MGAACIAIGTFVSALTENQIIAYLATFGALLICYLMNGIKSLFTSGNTLAFIVFCVVLAVVALLVGLACKMSRWAARCSAAVPWCWCCCLSCARPGC